MTVSDHWKIGLSKEASKIHMTPGMVSMCKRYYVSDCVVLFSLAEHCSKHVHDQSAFTLYNFFLIQELKEWHVTWIKCAVVLNMMRGRHGFLNYPIKVQCCGTLKCLFLFVVVFFFVYLQLKFVWNVWTGKATKTHFYWAMRNNDETDAEFQRYLLNIVDHYQVCRCASL